MGCIATHEPPVGEDKTTCAAWAPYPLFISFAGRRAVVVGGGRVAERKVTTLLEHGADVTVVAPAATEQIEHLANVGAIVWKRRPYEPGDLAGAFITFCATDNRTVNEAVYAEASSLNQLVNVVDVPDLCNAIVPSLISRGPLQIAVSTGGASPTTAREVRKSLEDQFPAWWGGYIETLGEVRGLIKARVTSGTEARTPLYEAVASDEELKATFAAGGFASAREVFDRIVAPLIEGTDTDDARDCKQEVGA